LFSGRHFWGRRANQNGIPLDRGRPVGDNPLPVGPHGELVTETGRRPMKHSERRVEDVVIIDLDGKLTLGAGDVQLRQIMADLMDRKETRILLNLAKVSYMDSAGTGELVAAYTTCNNNGASLKLLNLTAKVRDLLMFTQLISVFEDYSDTAEAVHSFNE
jgi:anti-sigma B factor antagonist